jgi:hypothetical protein
VSTGLDWLLSHQQANGLWRTGYPKTRDPLVNHWVTFAVARVIKRFFGIRALVGPRAGDLEVGARRRQVAAAAAR